MNLKIHSTLTTTITASQITPRVRKEKGQFSVKEPIFVTMGDQEVKLFAAWSSSFSKRVEIALKMKGINYKYVAESLSNKSPELLRYNPVHKKVPVVIHNGKPICESLVILEYIDEIWKSGPSILPEDPHARAMARFWCSPAIKRIYRSQGEEREKAVQDATEHLETLENELRGKKFFGGDEIGLVDLSATFIALWLGVLLELAGVELLTKEKFPRLCEWIDIYLNCSIVKETLPAREDLLDHLRSLRRPAK
ncbi:probable glutathione S-transferase isoform X2 [Daucus carota subsp. sativus]|uniref:probable glutathione S-transferase isoform X2 n=1 Tax=Daucus carota subsp. sativus TaxID=79200 RepID=UPI0030836C64